MALLVLFCAYTVIRNALATCKGTILVPGIDLRAHRRPSSGATNSNAKQKSSRAFSAAKSICAENENAVFTSAVMSLPARSFSRSMRRSPACANHPVVYIIFHEMPMNARSPIARALNCALRYSASHSSSRCCSSSARSSQQVEAVRSNASGVACFSAWRMTSRGSASSVI